MARARLLTVTDGMRAVFHGGKKDELVELSSVNCAGHYSVYTIRDCGKVGTYPNIDAIWPGAFENNPKATFAFNADYLKEIAQVVSKLCDAPNRPMLFMCNGATNPFVIHADYEPRVGQHFSNARLEFLLMPVQVRD